MLTSALLLLTLAATPPPTPPPSKEVPAGCLAAYKGSTHFCDGRVYVGAKKGHISWDAWWTTDTPKAARAHYLKTCGAGNHEGGTEDHWRFPKETPRTVLSLSAPGGKAVPWSRCKLPEKARTVILISRFPRL